MGYHGIELGKFRAGWGSKVDINSRRKKQQALIVHALERQVRSRAQQLYESRGETEGGDLQDWFQAEAEVLDNKPVAPLYRRMRTGQEAEQAHTSEELVSSDATA
jgi:hypothetical protein